MKEERAVNDNFGSMIKYLRKKRDLSLRAMKEMTGISESYINRLENGGRLCPSYPIIEKIASALGVHPKELLEVGSNEERSKLVPLDYLLLSNDFTVDGTEMFNPKLKESLLNLIDILCEIKWEKETIVDDIYEITQAVDEFKKAELIG
ncbi:helix-turn-helix domain-containing protein [Halalkalibacter akibai]|uniref:HTH cro/C1-type domain-containing protein n=1 Tax=Halalkalibacter akibai (strain ATCC 43226 / DSM 21942 / CIP 109018 / JCM 9157 / 1139) TaxID=1236973 RepID=W4R0F5_HALA3|nr:helix-turn-helix transcriptional regulator [Halalkalibacter akibai]GAE37388.1 hypothetical protein JCM9157_4665 [Halalkalibacter akibai JCM 9157]